MCCIFCRCCSYVGRQSCRFEQGITIGRSCTSLPTIIHEIGHTVGFWHEQSRPDRDEYIRVLHNNIASAFKSNFDLLPNTSINSLGIGYDYNSIMHYKEYTFGKNGKKTLEALDPSIPLGRAVELSKLDILQTNLLYKCGELMSLDVYILVMTELSVLPKPVHFYDQLQ